MGGTASTRKITLVNDEDSGVIKISDSVVKRLRGEIEQKSASRKAATTSATDGKVPPPVPPREQPSTLPHPQQSSSVPKQPPFPFTSYEDLRMNAQRVNQERDEEIRKLDAHWRAKLNAAEQQNNIVQNKMAEKFTSAVEEIGKKFPASLCEPICTDVQEKVQRCYEINQKTSLNCSKYVREFSDCVQQARLKTLSRG